MKEYIVGIKSGGPAPENWMEEVCTHRGVIKRAGDIKKILIKSSDEIIKQLEKKFPYLKIEFVLPHFRDEKYVNESMSSKRRIK